MIRRIISLMVAVLFVSAALIASSPSASADRGRGGLGRAFSGHGGGGFARFGGQRRFVDRGRVIRFPSTGRRVIVRDGDGDGFLEGIETLLIPAALGYGAYRLYRYNEDR
jgi:hypothetical protein